jgi:hypothetical protein
MHSVLRRGAAEIGWMQSIDPALEAVKKTGMVFALRKGR